MVYLLIVCGAAHSRTLRNSTDLFNISMQRQGKSQGIGEQMIELGCSLQTGTDFTRVSHWLAWCCNVTQFGACTKRQVHLFYTAYEG